MHHKIPDIAGEGGKEEVLEETLKSIFAQNIIRVNSPVYDFLLIKDGIKLEVKKQQDLQWFDIGKYGDHFDSDIQQAFVLYSKHGGIDKIFTIGLSSFLKLVTKDKKYKDAGWTVSGIKKCTKLKNQFKQLQFKSPLRMRPFLKKYGEHCEVVYDKNYLTY